MQTAFLPILPTVNDNPDIFVDPPTFQTYVLSRIKIALKPQNDEEHR
jgi:hypothetical protein